MDKEIRHAVKEYVDQLISDRSGPGRGMAVSAGDLLSAAREAGKKAYLSEVSAHYLRPGIDLIQHERVSNRQSKPGASVLPRKPQKTTSKPKGEPHWLTWKTGRTPAPEESIAPTPRPLTAVSVARPETRASLATPAPYCPPSPDVEIVDLKIDFRAPSAARSRQPTPSVYNAARAPSVQAARAPSVQPSRYTPCASRAATPHIQGGTVPAPPKPTVAGRPDYMPALKAWVDNANDYERDVAHSLMQVLQSKSCPPVHSSYPRPKSGATRANNNKMAAFRRANLHTAGVMTTRPMAWQQMEPDMDQHCADAYHAGPSLGPRPFAERRKFKPAQRQPVHQAACFMDAHKPYRGSFTINPEWVSEVKMWKNPQSEKTAHRNTKSCVRY